MTYAATVLADSPLIFLQFDEVSGTFVDASPNARTGITSAGTITYQKTSLLPTGEGKAIGLPGSAGITVANGAWQNQAVLTQEIWMKPSAVSGNTYICGRDDLGGVGTNRYTCLFYDSTGTVSASLCTGTGSLQSAAMSPAGAIVAGGTYHLVQTWDGTVMTLYINGVQQTAQIWDPAGVVTINTTVVPPITIGRPGVANQTIWNFVGDLDNYAFYSTVLSQARISAHAAGGATTEEVSRVHAEALLVPKPTIEISRATSYALFVLPPQVEQISRVHAEVLWQPSQTGEWVIA